MRILVSMALTWMILLSPAMAEGIDWQAVERAGLMKPAAKGDWRPEAGVTRAELASVLSKAFELRVREQGSGQGVDAMADVPTDHWARTAIDTVISRGIMSGYRPGRFFPDHGVTRAEGYSAFAQAYGVFAFDERYVDTVLAKYPDADKIPDWGRKAMATALKEGFVRLEDGHIHPLRPMSRSDLAYALSWWLRRQNRAAYAAPLQDN